MKQRIYPLLALMLLVLTMLACDGGNGIVDLDPTRQYSAWCGNSTSYECTSK
jgi:hypothetical protein